MGNIWGVILGGGFLAYLNQEGLGNIGGWLNSHFSGQSESPDKWFTIWHADIDVPLYQYGIFGVILVLVMLFKPEGLIPSSRRKAEFREGVADEPLYDVQQ
jgi:branched-chain amino acid transport system permease protein